MKNPKTHRQFLWVLKAVAKSLRCGAEGLAYSARFFLDSPGAVSARLRWRISRIGTLTSSSGPLALSCVRCRTVRCKDRAVRRDSKLFAVHQGGTMKKYLAELVGTFILVLFGCGTAVIAGDKVAFSALRLAFGLALIGGRLRDRPHLRLPHQSRGEPGRVGCRTDDAWRHDRLLGRAICGRDSCGLGAVGDCRRHGGIQPCGQRAGAGWLGTRLPGRIQHRIGHCCLSSSRR